jgi:hypothetical protein
MPHLLQTSFAAAWFFGRRGSWYRTPSDPETYLACGQAIAERAAVACLALDRQLTIVVLLAPAGVVRYLADPAWREELDTERARFLEVPLDMLDLIPAQVSAYRAERSALFAPLAHWSSRGNRIWADEIADHLGLE